MKIFGREPALAVAVIAAAITLLAVLGIPGLSKMQATAIIALVDAAAGVVIAWRTRPWAPGVFTAVVAAAAAVAGTYGLEISAEAVASANALVIAVLAFIVRGQVSPAGSVADGGTGSVDAVPVVAGSAGQGDVAPVVPSVTE